MIRVLGVVGMPGSGKGEFCSLALGMWGEEAANRVYFGQIVRDEVARRGLPLTPKNERIARTELREKHGRGVMAEMSISRIERELREYDIVILDGVRNLEEVKILREKFGDEFGIVAIHTDKEIRHNRLANRPERPFTKEEAEARDMSEVEVNDQGSSIALADWNIINNEDMDDLRFSVRSMWFLLRDQ